jgi:hypothetical protein
MTPNRTVEYLAMWTRVTVLYDDGRMADALQVVDAIGRRFPERGAYMSSPRACLHAVMGEIDEAIRVIRDTIERGWWWSEGRVADPAPSGTRVPAGDRSGARTLVSGRLHGAADPSPGLRGRGGPRVGFRTCRSGSPKRSMKRSLPEFR